ncbi:ATP-binding protein [Synechococcus sp. BA-132 BA5]|uniref:ATP-binding protein n=1 Tax=Synechococcus sp. BA-132 BA5 TaxID=3110252 RepID=UPI002B213566|nr:ATP-binding protein [Synechococcus sp. BA-132 BA5]
MAERTLFRSVQQRLLDLAMVTAAEMDGELHTKIRRPDQMGSPLYRQASKPLIQLRTSVSEIFYAYTLRGRSKPLYFALDTTVFIKNPGDDFSAPIVGQLYGDAPSDALIAARLAKPRVSSVPYTDQWGTFLSAYAPFQDGNATALVGVDLSLATLNQQLFPLRLSLGLSLAGSALLSAFAGFLHCRYLRSTASALESSLEAADLARQAAAESQQANLAKSTFLATMGHELRTPLNGVIGLSNILLSTGLTPHQQSCLQTVRNSGESLLLLLNQLLDFSAIDSGNLVIDSAPCPLRPLFADVMALFAEQAQTKGLVLALSLDPSLPDVVLSDPLHLRQIVVNLVSNAIKYTVRGEVTITVSSQASLPDGRVPLVIFVRDTGPGIVDSSRNSLFQPFTQADSTTTRVHGGAGLGLSICHHLLVAMGGTIEVESEHGQGSLFTVTLPVAIPESPQAADVPPTASFAEGHPLRILLAEDNVVNARVCELMLQRLGYGASVARDGEEAVIQQRQLDPDIILMDLRMPNVDGFDATRRIREHTGNTVRPWIVAVTANIRDCDRAEALTSGMNDFIGKPISVESLQAALSRAHAAVQAQ